MFLLQRKLGGYGTKMQSEICKCLLEARELGGSLTQIYILKFLRFEADSSSLESRKMIEFAIKFEFCLQTSVS